MAKANGVLSRLKAWAVAGGAESEALTNAYELVRLRVRGGVAIVYRTDKGTETWNLLATQLRATMLNGGAFPPELHPSQKTRARGTSKLAHKTLLERDGPGCFFCGIERDDSMTIEHLVPCAHGGPNHLSNKFRACQPCNGRAGHMSAPEKIRMRDQLRAKRDAA